MRKSPAYRYFGLIGGPIQVLALLAAIVLTWHMRRRPGFGWTLAGTLFLALSLLLWFLRVQWVNQAWLEAMRSHPESVVDVYARLRGRWEWGHVMAFVAWLIGFVLLLYAALRQARPHGGDRRGQI